MVDERIDRKPDYRQGTEGGSASSPTLEESRAMEPILSGLIVGSVVAVLFGWIPLVGGFAAGFAAGWVARTRIRGLYAAFVPGILAMAWYWLVTYLPDFPFAWADRLEEVLAPAEVIFLGTSALVFAAVFMGQFLLALIGGWVGGLLMERREGRESMERTGRPF